MRRLLIGATIAGALLSWSSCTPYYAQAEWIDPAPPAPRYEEVPPAPFADGFWVSGYWNWTGGTYIWVPGSWQRPPRRGLYWYPGGYVRRDNRYQYVPGRWAPRSYRPTQRYVHPRYYPPTGGGYNQRRGLRGGGGGTRRGGGGGGGRGGGHRR